MLGTRCCLKTGILMLLSHWGYGIFGFSPTFTHLVGENMGIDRQQSYNDVHGWYRDVIEGRNIDLDARRAGCAPGKCTLKKETSEFSTCNLYLGANCLCEHV